MSHNIIIRNIHLHKNIEKPVFDLLEKYYTSSNLLNIVPDYSYHNYYIASDQHIGLVMTKDFTDFNAVSQNDISKILLMKIHHSVLDYYNLNGEIETAKFFYNLFNF